MNPNHTTATTEADPNASVVRSDNRVNWTSLEVQTPDRVVARVRSGFRRSEADRLARPPRGILRGPARWRTHRLALPFPMPTPPSRSWAPSVLSAKAAPAHTKSVRTRIGIRGPGVGTRKRRLRKNSRGIMGRDGPTLLRVGRLGGKLPVRGTAEAGPQTRWVP